MKGLIHIFIDASFYLKWLFHNYVTREGCFSSHRDRPISVAVLNVIRDLECDLGVGGSKVVISA